MPTTIGIKLFYELPDSPNPVPKPLFEKDVENKTPEDQVLAFVGSNAQGKGNPPDAVEGVEVSEGTARWLKGVSTIPALQGAPSAISTTSLEDYEEQSEPGLITNSNLAITMNYKLVGYAGIKAADNTVTGAEMPAADGSNFQECLNIDRLDVPVKWLILLPNGRWFAFWGKARTVTADLGQAAALTFTLGLYKKSKVTTGWINFSQAGRSNNTRMLKRANNIVDTEEVEE